MKQVWIRLNTVMSECIEEETNTGETEWSPTGSHVSASSNKIPQLWEKSCCSFLQLVKTNVCQDSPCAGLCLGCQQHRSVFLHVCTKVRTKK